LTTAIDIQRRCYRLLRWLSREAAAERLSVPVHPGFMSQADLAVEWLVSIAPNLPEDARPPQLDDPDLLRKYANYFASYVETSFDFDGTPRRGWVAGPCGCDCPLCRVLAMESPLRRRKVSARAKQSAKQLSARALVQLASELGHELTEADAMTMVADPQVRAPSALLAYVADLFERLEGWPGDASSLALWRRFAYTPSGAPIQGFELTVELVMNARDTLRQIQFG
jgi:hypothetical protein